MPWYPCGTSFERAAQLWPARGGRDPGEDRGGEHAARTATAASRTFPDASPAPAATRAAAAEETTQPASSDQPARGASAPCRVNRRNAKAVASSGPASGTETDTAFAA